MTAFFVAFATTLRPAQLAARRRRLAALLGNNHIELRTLPLGDGKSIIQRLWTEARGAPVIVLDDGNSDPTKSPWIRELMKQAADLTAHRRPHIIYLTEEKTAAGSTHLLEHPIIRHYVGRDAKGHWVARVAKLATEVTRQMQAVEVAAPATVAQDGDGIVGVSPCFREAVEELGRIMRLPYGIVTGEAGVGKLFLIQSLWRQWQPEAPLVMMACGSFYKDYYIGISPRRFGGGRDAVNELGTYLTEADEGLLVLHHVERLPTAVQEELVTRLSIAERKGMKSPVVGVDHDELAEHDVRILATSTRTPQELRNRGLIEELAVKLAKRHVRIPSLAQRGPEDVELICRDVLRRIVHCAAADSGRDKLVPEIAPSALRLLRQAKCADNVSDLLRWLEYAWRHCDGHTIERRHLPADIALSRSHPPSTLAEIGREAQRSAIRNTLDQTGGDMTEAARRLGRNRSGLYRSMRKLGMREPERDA